MAYLLLENPWPLAILLIAVAAIVRVVGRRTRRAGLNHAALGGLIVAVGIVGLAYLVTTEREHLIQKTRALVEATLPPEGQNGSSSPGVDQGGDQSNGPRVIDVASIRELNIDRATLRGPNGQVWIKPGQVPGRLERAIERNPIEGQSIATLRIDPRSSVKAIAHLRVRTRFTNEALMPTPTTWRITWERQGKSQPWYVSDVQWMEWRNRPPPSLNW